MGGKWGYEVTYDVTLLLQVAPRVIRPSTSLPTEPQRVAAWMDADGWVPAFQNPKFKSYVAALVKAIWDLSESKHPPDVNAFYV